MSVMRNFHKSDIELCELLDSIDYCLSIRRDLESKISYKRSTFRSIRDPDSRYWFGQTHTLELKDLAEILHKNRSKIKLMISGSWAYVYSDDLDFLERLSLLEYTNYPSLKKITVNRPKGTVLLKNSAHSLRTYFADIWLTANEKESIVAFLTSQADIRLSPALDRWCKNNTLWSQRNHFIDYSLASFPLSLQLINPRLIRKTMTIIEVNN